MNVSPLRRTMTLAALTLLAGCATFPSSRGLDETHALIEARGGSSPPIEGPLDCSRSDAAIAPLVAEPLTADSAIQIMLMCNTQLAAEYARLGISRADTFQAARVANPTLSAALLDSSARGAAPQIELGLVQNFTNLLLRGPRSRLAEGEFLRAQQQLAGKVLQLSAEAKADYYALVGAQQIATVRHAIGDALQTSAELAQRFRAAGNLSARALAEYEASAGQALVDARNADNAAATASAALTLQLGLPLKTAWSVPDRLSVPVAEEDTEDALLQRADLNRLDLAAARGLVTLLADSERSAREFRWLGDFSVGVSYEREPDRSRLLGPSLSIQLPIFDRGQGPVARAQSLKTWSDAEQRRLTQAVAGAVQLAWQRTLNARDRAQDYRLQIIPQRQAVVARTQEEQNFMLVGVFELLAAKRAEFDAYQGYLEALRDYWVARAELERAVGARLPSDAQTASETIGTAQLLTPAPAPDEHTMSHGGMSHGGMQHDGAHMPGKKIPPSPSAKKPPDKSSGAHDAQTDDHEHHGDTP